MNPFAWQSNKSNPFLHHPKLSLRFYSAPANRGWVLTTIVMWRKMAIVAHELKRTVMWHGRVGNFGVLSISESRFANPHRTTLQHWPHVVRLSKDNSSFSAWYLKDEPVCRGGKENRRRDRTRGEPCWQGRRRKGWDTLSTEHWALAHVHYRV